MKSFFVPGIPKPGGSKSFMGFSRKGRAILVDASKNVDWKNAVWCAAKQEFLEPMQGPIYLKVVFVMPRPKYHFRKNGELKPDAPKLHTITPDRTKLLRSTEDAMKGIAWLDDGQVCAGPTLKIYGAKPGAFITISDPMEVEA